MKFIGSAVSNTSEQIVSKLLGLFGNMIGVCDRSINALMRDSMLHLERAGRGVIVVSRGCLQSRSNFQSTRFGGRGRPQTDGSHAART